MDELVVEDVVMEDDEVGVGASLELESSRISRVQGRTR